MLEKPPVFDSQNSVHQNFGNFVVLHQLTLGTLLGIEQRRNHLGLEFVGSQLAGLPLDALHLPTANADGGRFRAVVGIRARLDLDCVSEEMVAAHEGLAISLCISRPAKAGSDLASLDLLANLHGLRYGVNLGRVAENLSLELLINDVVVFQVVVRKHAGENYCHCEKYNQARPNHRIAGEQSFSAARTGRAIRDSDFNGHSLIGGDASLQLDDDAGRYRYPKKKILS